MQRLDCISLAVLVVLLALTGAAPVFLRSSAASTSDLASLSRATSNSSSTARDQMLPRNAAKEDKTDGERTNTLYGLVKSKNFASLIVSKLKQKGIERKLERWIQEEWKPVELYANLGLHKKLKTLLTEPDLITFIAFLKRYNEVNIVKVYLIDILSDVHGYIALARMLETEKLTSTNAKNFQALQFLFWRAQGYKSRHIFDVLNVRDVPLEKLLADPGFNIWYSYTKVIQETWPTEEDKVMNSLREFDDTKLAETLEAATKLEAKDPSTVKMKEIATTLQSEQFRYWVANMENPVTIRERFPVKPMKAYSPVSSDNPVKSDTFVKSDNSDISTKFKDFYDALAYFPSAT